VTSGKTDPGRPDVSAGCGIDRPRTPVAVLGDTALGIEQIAGHFGAEIAGLVAELTEDLRIRRYPARKAEARARAIRDRRVAATMPPTSWRIRVASSRTGTASTANASTTT
jgi:(p)ppGpp synthase/HD superfamily hydrolase